MNGLYHVSEKAVQDIDNIWLYTFKSWSESQADKYYILIIENIEYILQVQR
jgi:toxin ParE1/3/4